MERDIYEVRRLVGFTSLIYELTQDGGFTVSFTAPDGRRGRLRMLLSEPHEPRHVAAAVMRKLRTPIPQPAPPAGP
jgi:hypothetical protein